MPETTGSRAHTSSIAPLGVVIRIALGLAAWGCAADAGAAETDVLAAQIAGLAQTPAAVSGDWLAGATVPHAVVCRGERPGEIALDNGLVRRVFRLAPNAATVSLAHRLTGVELVRAVEPEARLRIDGVDYQVGGLDGQPIRNYLEPDWLERMSADPGAFRFRSFAVGTTAARFPWKKHPEWMPADLPWPAPGVSLTLSFEVPSASRWMPATRPVLLDERFAAVDPAWKVVLSPAHPRTAFRNEGKQGEIMAQENTCAFAERPLPPQARAVECTVDPGTDRSASWGPGIAVVFPGRTVKVNLRPGRGCFGVNAGDGEREVGKLVDGAAYTVRAAWDGHAVACEASSDGKAWTMLARVPVAGQPTTLRVGKTDAGGGSADFAEPGALQRCRIVAVAVHGAPQPVAGAPVERIAVDVHYELYDGLPLLCKWLTVRNGSSAPIRLESVVSERLAIAETESAGEANAWWEQPPLVVETDYAFLAMNGKSAALRGARWLPDRAYATQVNYDLTTPCLLECGPEFGPDVELAPGEDFASIRAFELMQDSSDRERRGLALRRMYRAIAPWVTENPLIMHLTSADPAAIRAAIDQCAEVGFEMLILSFGSGFDLESRDAAYQRRYRELADYARERHVALGGYSLLASRGAADAADNCKPGRIRFGVMPCLGSRWGIDYLAQLRSFIGSAGLGVLEHDGSYPGDTCAATGHPGHRGLADSQWRQWQAITALYRWCRAEGVYLNIPDWYFLTGGSKTAMGYRETNWSLPREEQVIIERQNIFDGTWEKTPSMGWMFVPLTQYHGGGAAATIEPLDQHRDHYEARLADLLGAGVQACWRGPRLYDSDATKALVKRWVAFYKGHRAILDSDIIHLRRPDGRDWDGILHVDPQLAERGLAMLSNPLGEPITRRIALPLRYAALEGSVSVQVDDGAPALVPIDARGDATIAVTIPARGRSFVVLRRP